MKKFTLIVFTLLCFGIAKAHVLPKINIAGLKPNITIIPINNLPDYNVTFRYIPKHYYGKLEMVSVQNKIAIIEPHLRLRSITSFKLSKN